MYVFDLRGEGVSIGDLLPKTKLFSFESDGFKRVKATAQTVHHGNNPDPGMKGRVLCKYTVGFFFFLGLRPPRALFLLL